MSQQQILMVTADDALYAHWQQVQPQQWLAHRARTLQELQDWIARGQVWAMVDEALLHSAHEEAAGPEQGAVAGPFPPTSRVLILSSTPSDALGHQWLQQGAMGYVHTHLPVATLEQVLATLAGGAIWMGRSLLQRLLQDIHERVPPKALPDQVLEALSVREREVALLAAQGRSNLEIALELEITERTVRAHLSAVFAKLEVTDRLKLALRLYGIGT